jgi:hypothetical protein
VRALNSAIGIALPSAAKVRHGLKLKIILWHGRCQIAVRQSFSKDVDPARLFVIAPKLNADGIKDKG